MNSNLKSQIMWEYEPPGVRNFSQELLTYINVPDHLSKDIGVLPKGSGYKMDLVITQSDIPLS